MSTKRPKTSSPPDRASIYEGLSACVDVAYQIEVERLLLAAQWAIAADTTHPATVVHYPNVGRKSVWDELAARGLPHVDELELPVLAARSGMSEYRTHDLVLAALLLVYVFPRTWAQVLARNTDSIAARYLVVDAWHAGLTPEAMDHLDRHVSVNNTTLGPKAREAFIKEAKLRRMPEVVAAEDERARETRDVRTIIGDIPDGLTRVEATLNVEDARDLEKGVQHEAARIAAAGTLTRCMCAAPSPWAISLVGLTPTTKVGPARGPRSCCTCT